jgi:hypothetical protein
VGALIFNAVLLFLFLSGGRHDKSLTSLSREEIEEPAASRPPGSEYTRSDDKSGRTPLPGGAPEIAGAESIPVARRTELPSEMDTLTADVPVAHPSAGQDPSSFGPAVTDDLSLANPPDR